ncbi:MAG: hypothetical protein ACQSGP_23320 [Frankia sp.]
MRRGHRQGRLAKQLIRKVGDAGTALAGAEMRPKVLKSLEDAEIEKIRASSRTGTRAVEALIAELRLEMDTRAERRERQLEMVKDKVEQGRLWRAIGVQERIPSMAISASLRVVTLILLASLDFYVFAQAYAVVADVGGYGVQWWLGGLLGLAVFVAGLALAHAIKDAILAHAQREMLKEATDGKMKIDPHVRERLVESRPSILALLLTATIFSALSVAGVLVRVNGAGTTSNSMAVVFFQALIPLVSVVVELYLHDPTERDEPRPNAVDHQLERRLVKAEKRLRAIAQGVESEIAKVERLYKVEAAILDIEQKDMGLRDSGDAIAVGSVSAAYDPSPGTGPMTIPNTIPTSASAAGTNGSGGNGSGGSSAKGTSPKGAGSNGSGSATTGPHTIPSNGNGANADKAIRVSGSR